MTLPRCGAAQLANGRPRAASSDLLRALHCRVLKADLQRDDSRWSNLQVPKVLKANVMVKAAVRTAESPLLSAGPGRLPFSFPLEANTGLCDSEWQLCPVDKHAAAQQPAGWRPQPCHRLHQARSRADLHSAVSLLRRGPLNRPFAAMAKSQSVRTGGIDRTSGRALDGVCI